MDAYIKTLMNAEKNKVWYPVTKASAVYMMGSTKTVQQVLEELQGQFTVIYNKVMGISTVDWAEVQANVRAGNGATLYPVGTVFKMTCGVGSEFDELYWKVIGHDIDTTDDSNYPHTMTLVCNVALINMPYGIKQAFYYAESGLSAGTYYFDIPATYDADYNDLITYQFTLTKAVPAGGQLTFAWGYHEMASSVNVVSYASPATLEPIETLTVTQGSTGTYLGWVDQGGDPDRTYINDIDRVRYGSNNYVDSIVRQWLISDGAENTWWAAGNNFDRKPQFAVEHNGFLHGLPSDFVAVLGSCPHVVNTNRIFDPDGKRQSVTITDKVFLLGVLDMTNYPYYEGAGNIHRIFYDENGTARPIWMRDCDPGCTQKAYKVDETGEYGVAENAENSLYAVPCVVIR